MRSETRRDSRLFGEVMRSLLKEGLSVRFYAEGRSMYPAIADGELVQVDLAGAVDRGDVVIVESADGLRVHRVNGLGTRGDCCFEADRNSGAAIGTVSLVKGDIVERVPRQRLGSMLRRWLARWRGRF